MYLILNAKLVSKLGSIIRFYKIIRYTNDFLIILSQRY